eukprot:s4539_g10.t1
MSRTLRRFCLQTRSKPIAKVSTATVPGAVCQPHALPPCQERHALEKRELALIVEQVEREEKNREMADITDHQSQFELIRNKNIEEDHQMRSGLEEQIEETRARCKERLQAYEKSTESSTTEYKDMLTRSQHFFAVVPGPRACKWC